MLKTLHILTVSILFSIHSFAMQDLLLSPKSASTLNKVTLYPDSSFFKHSNVTFEQGTLFEVISESDLEHENTAQTQKFKWYKVKTPTGKTGWVFGDKVAIMQSASKLDNHLKHLHRQKINLGKGFENAIMWIATVNGREQLHANDFLNPPYHETYLIVTNRYKKSVHLRLESATVEGTKQVESIKFMDVTNDVIPEIVLQTTSSTVKNPLKNENLSIFALQAGRMDKILDEYLSLTYKSEQKSPAIKKHIEIEDATIRVEYIDYIPCTQYHADISVQAINPDMERCMEYVTYTYMWHPQKKAFDLLYDKTQTSVSAISKYAVSIKEHPSSTAKSVESLAQHMPLQVVKHFEKTVLQNRKKRVEHFFLVQKENGMLGYVPAQYIQFRTCFHAPILDTFYSQNLVNKNVWNYNTAFVKYTPEKRTSLHWKNYTELNQK